MSHFTKRTRSAAQACGTILFGFVFAGLVHAADAPLMGVLDRFTAPDVPAMGPAETAVNPRKPSTSTANACSSGPSILRRVALWPHCWSGRAKRPRRSSILRWPRG